MNFFTLVAAILLALVSRDIIVVIVNKLLDLAAEREYMEQEEGVTSYEGISLLREPVEDEEEEEDDEDFVETPYAKMNRK